MIKTLAHFCIHANDLERTRKFYCDILGLRQKFRFIEKGKPYGFYLEIDDRHFIEVFEAPKDGEPQNSRITHFCLESDNLEALRERLIAHGVEVTPLVLACDHTWQMWCTDPDGVSIELQQYTPESTQLTGKDCVV